MKKGRASGFALIAALMSVWILTALGVLVFTVTTQDVRISSRMVGEKKAFLATEAGVHRLASVFDRSNLNDTSNYNIPVQVDPDLDPDTEFRIGGPTVPLQGPASISMPGYSQSWGAERYISTVTGVNNRYQSSVQVQVGVGFGPVEITTSYR